MKSIGVIAFASILLVIGLSDVWAAEDYSYYVSGYPAENPSQSKASVGIALETAMCAKGSAATSLEARFRSILESIGIRLNTFEAKGMMLIFK